MKFYVDKAWPKEKIAIFSEDQDCILDTKAPKSVFRKPW